MSNPILTTTNSKLDTRVKEPSGVVPPPSGISAQAPLDRFRHFCKKGYFCTASILYKDTYARRHFCTS